MWTSWYELGFHGGSDCKESVCMAGDLGLIPGSGRSLGEGNGYPLQYSCLENSMDRSIVNGVTKNHTRLCNNTSVCVVSTSLGKAYLLVQEKELFSSKYVLFILRADCGF